MAKSNVTLEFSGEQEKLVRSLERSSREVENLKMKLREVGTQSKETDSFLEKAFTPRAVLGYVKALTGVGGVLGALHEINAALEHKRELEKESSAAQVSTHQTRQDLVRYLGAGAETTAMVLGLGRGIARQADVGVDEKFILPALQRLVRPGGENIPAAVATTRLAAAFLRDRPEEIGGFAASLGDLGRVAGLTDPRAALGLMQLVRKQAGGAEGAEVLATLRAQMGFGATAGEAGSLFAALSSGGKLGGAAENAAATLARELREFRPVAGISTMGGRIAALQAEPKMARRFLRGATGFRGAGSEGAIEQLLMQPESEVARQFRGNLAAFPGAEGLAEMGQAAVDNLGLDPLAANAAMGAGFGQIADELQVGNVRGGRNAILREGIMRTLRASGMGYLREKVARAKLWMGELVGGDMAIQGQQMLRMEEALYLRPFSVGAPNGARTPTPEEYAIANALRRAVDVLERIQRNTANSGAGPGMVPAGADR